MHPRLSFEARLRPGILAILGIGVDELPIGRVGVVVGVAPERELNPRALTLDPANRDTAKAVLDPVGLKPQAQDRVAQAVGVIRLQEQAVLAEVSGPEAAQVAATIIDLEGQTHGDTLAATALHATAPLGVRSGSPMNGSAAFRLHNASVVI